MLYDSDGAEYSYTSGEKDDAAGEAVAVLKEVGAPASPIGTYPAASHVEVKAAAAMRARDAIPAVQRRAGMSLTAQQSRAWTDFGVNRHEWVVSGVFHVGAASYQCEFRAEPELRRWCC